MYEIVFEKRALKFFEKLDKSVQNKLGKKIEQLKQNPKFGVPLVANLSGLWKLRAEKYRIIYKIINDKLIILILDIGHRKNIYS
jgi:mRNA interferase RelE/StbE